MIDRLILSAAVGLIGLNGLLPASPQKPVPLTSAQLQAKGKHKSISNVCDKKKKSKKVKEMCDRWGKHND
jgi:hypothetical protein